MEELWAPIPGYNGRYAVSSFGRTMVIGPDVTGRHRYIGHCPKNYPASGYPMTHLMYGDEKKSVHVHRLVAQAFLGPPPPGKQVNHKDGDRANPRLENLEYVTQSENALHRIDTFGSYALYGTNHWNARLSEDDLRSIFELSREGFNQAELGRRFNVTDATVSRILSGKRRKKDGYDKYHQ